MTDIEIQRYQNKSKFKGAYSQNKILKIINDEAYLVNLDKHISTGTHLVTWLCMYMLI